MTKLFFGSALATVVLAGAATSAEVTGGYLDLGYSTFTDSVWGDKYNLNGSVELAFDRSFSLQLDLGGYRFQDLGENGTNVTLHANLHAAPNASFGAFFGQDNTDGEDWRVYGLEAGFDAGGATIEGYLGRQEVKGFSGLDGILFGISSTASLNDDWDLHASYDLMTDLVGVLDAGTFTMGAHYSLTDQAEVYGEFGATRFSADGGNSTETFVGIGVRMNLGNNRGTTFGRRGVFDKLPGLPDVGGL
ncbi:conserved hypothetical protein [Ruegeria lacuscaerulensis ITI-1157]|nr:conserved hypothetical protein [Ruegeria lacuscaerulensis ITI-1157]SHI66111.1 porin [Ruegeria lacuscaerulensis ITI-1157]